MYDFTLCKYCKKPGGAPTYRLREATTVYVCQCCGFHYIDYMDPLQDSSERTASTQTDERHFQYIETVLESSRSRFDTKLHWVRRYAALQGARCLDIGAGGGLFMHLLAREGAEVSGIEIDPGCARFALHKYGLKLSDQPVESSYWQEGHIERFDVVTLWDVIEHVNLPVETIRAAARLLKPGGILYIDTPVRDSFLHRASEVSYRISRGRYPLFFNMQYSNVPFGHKQIFSCVELRRLSESVGLEVLELQRFHELSFPLETYLLKLLRFKPLARVCGPPTGLFFSLFRVRNKGMVAARRPSEPV